MSINTYAPAFSRLHQPFQIFHSKPVFAFRDQKVKSSNLFTPTIPRRGSRPARHGKPFLFSGAPGRNDPEEQVTREPVTKGLLIMPWYTYIVECSDGSYYVGITNDVSSRIAVRRPVSSDDEV